MHVFKTPAKMTCHRRPSGSSRVGGLHRTQNPRDSNGTEAGLPPASFPWRPTPGFPAATRRELAAGSSQPAPAPPPGRLAIVPGWLPPGPPRAGAVRHRPAPPGPGGHSAGSLQDAGAGRGPVGPLQCSPAERGPWAWGADMPGKRDSSGRGATTTVLLMVSEWLQGFVRGRWGKTMINGLRQETAVSSLGG